MSDQIFYLFSALLLGLVVGALIMYFATGSNKDSEQTIAKLEKELENYQQDVVDHFEQTADLVDGMTKSYKKVFDHLGKSARKLMTEEQIQEQLESRRGNKVTLEYLTESSDDKRSTSSSEDSPVKEIDEIVEVEKKKEKVEVSLEESEIAEINSKEPEAEEINNSSEIDNEINNNDEGLTEVADEKLEEDELRTILKHAILQLPEKRRRIFELSRFDGMKYGKIADHLSISVKTVEGQMTKALKYLRVVLKDYIPLLLIFIIQRFLY